MAKKERYVRVSDLKRLARWKPERTRGGLYVFYKVVRGESRASPYSNPREWAGRRDIRYLDGEVIIEDDIDRRSFIGCGRGLHVMVHAPQRAAYTWDVSHALLLQVLVREDDIACVPKKEAKIFDTNKLRVRRLLVVGVIKQKDIPRDKLAEGWKWPLTWKGALGK